MGLTTLSARKHVRNTHETMSLSQSVLLHNGDNKKALSPADTSSPSLGRTTNSRGVSGTMAICKKVCVNSFIYILNVE